MPSQTFNSSGTWPVPADADPSSVRVQAWGEGGNGGTGKAGTGSFGAGGAGSGEYAEEAALGGLTPGLTVLTVTVGGGGSAVSTQVTGGSVAVVAHAGASGSGVGAGAKGTGSTNGIHRDGAAGGSGIVHSNPGGGSGAGAAGSGGTGNAGAAGSLGTPAAGGTGGTPDGGDGGDGGSGITTGQPGQDGAAPGGGGGGGAGRTGGTAGGNGAPGRVIITWATQPGVVVPVAMVSISAPMPAPAASNLKVTATAGGSAVNGLLLRVRVLNNAALPTSLNTATQAAAAGAPGTPADVAFTPAATGSLAYSVVTVNSATIPAAVAGNTAVDGGIAGHGTFVSTATLTANTPFTAGSSTAQTGGVAALEVTPFGGTIATDASSPAVVNATGATTATTAAFAPPTGSKLLLALVSSLGGTGQVAMAVSDSFGLTWTQAVAADDAGKHYAGIWYAYSPANVTFASIAPDPAVVGTAYSYQLAATGGYGNYGWTVATGSLPAGLTLNGSTGLISGTPTVAGLSTFTLTVADGFGNSVTSGNISLVVNKGTTPGGVIPATWTGAALPYSYATLDIPVANADHDWLFVSVSWVQTQDQAVAFVCDDAHNLYEPCAFTASGVNRTQVFSVPNARAASHVYVSTSAYVKWLTACVTDMSGLQPGYTLDVTPAAVSGGPGTTLNLSLSTVQPDFILATGAFRGTPGTITPSGSGATWTSIGWGGINGSDTDGLTQAVAWAETTGAASPAMTFTAASGTFSGCMVAVYTQGGLPVNGNPAWPVIKCQAAFGYLPHEPTAVPVWTDITSRFLGFKGGRGRSFELDEISAADVTVTLDNFDGALSPQNSQSPYYPNVTLITPIRLVAVWQGRTESLFRGIIHAIPQTYDFQRGMVEVAASDDWSKLPQTLLAQAMIQDMLYDKPLHLWPLNEQQGALGASNWSGRSAQSLAPTAATLSAPVQTGGGTRPGSQFTLNIFGQTLTVAESALSAQQQPPQQLWAGLIFSSPVSKANPSAPGPPPTPTTPATGFGNNLDKTYPSGLMGTADSTWGNTTALTASNYYQGSVLADSGDSTLPLTGSTWSVWARMYYVPSNTSAVIMCLSDNRGTAGSSVYLKLSYDGTNITAAQTTGSHNFTPPAYLFDSQWHLWTVVIDGASGVTLKLDGVTLGSYTATFPAGAPTMIQWGGDSTATTATAAGIFTGSQYLAGIYDRIVDNERILSWAQSGITGFLNELAGQRVSRILTWTRWGAAQAVDRGITKQQQFNYLGGGYASNGLSGAVGNFATAGGAIGVDSGSQADMTIQDVANSENASLFMAAGGEVTLRENDNPSPDVGIALGDMDYALNQTTIFDLGLGEWTHTTSCTVAVSGDWSYANQDSALMTVTGTPVSAKVEGGPCLVTAGQQAGFGFWAMSPQGCSAQAVINWYNSGGSFISPTTGATFSLPPVTPVFINVSPDAAPAGAASAKGQVVITGSPATGTQLYFDRTRLSPAGFQASYQGSLQVVEDVQYLYNDVVLTRNVDQAGYRVRDEASRQRYYPRVYTRTVYSSADDPQAVVDVADALLSQFSQPQLRVAQLVVNCAADPENWDFVLAAGIGDSVSFSRHPVGGADVTGDFVVLHVEPDVGPDKADFTYVLAPSGFS